MKPATDFKFIVSFKCAFEGVRYALRTQPNFRFHLIAALAVTVLAFWLEISLPAWAVLLLTITVVLVIELLNTAFEVLVDLVTPEYHPLAKIVKDLTAGAVLVTAVGSVIVGLIILGPPLWLRLFP